MFYSIIKQILIVKYFSTLKWFNQVSRYLFKKKNVQEILDKFKVNNCNSMSALIEFGLKLNRNQGERHPLQENYIGSYFDVSNNKKARYNLCNKSC